MILLFVFLFLSRGATVSLVEQENNRICWTVCISNMKVQCGPGLKPQLCFNEGFFFFVKCCFPFLSMASCSTNFLLTSIHFPIIHFLPHSHSIFWNLYLCLAFLIILKPPQTSVLASYFTHVPFQFRCVLRAPSASETLCCGLFVVSRWGLVVGLGVETH